MDNPRTEITEDHGDSGAFDILAEIDDLEP
jgi:hypothetical protein